MRLPLAPPFALAALLAACAGRAPAPASAPAPAGAQVPADAAMPSPATASRPSDTRTSAPAPSASVPAVSGGAALPFETLIAGVSACLAGPEGRARAIGDDDAWRDWLSRAACRREGAPPAVEFAHRLVLAADGPDGTNACHAVRITRVTQRGDELAVDVTRYEPEAGRACAQIVIRPMHAVAVDRPAGEARVTFSWRSVKGAPSP